MPANTTTGGKEMPTLTLNSAREATGSMIDDKNMIVKSSFFIVFPSFSTDMPFRQNISFEKNDLFSKNFIM